MRLLAQGLSVRMFLVVAFAACLFFARLGERAFWSEEVRWAEIPREMLQSSDYLHPTINGKTYYDKPLGSYWLVLAASWLTGTLDETSVRLPSALSGLIAVVLLMRIARRLYGETTAWLAGIILATSFSFVFFARHASADAETVAGVLAALWLFLRNEQHPAGWWLIWLWLVMALTSLTKGLLGFVLPMLIIGVYSSLTPAPAESTSWISRLLARNRWFFNAKTLLAIPLAAAVYLGPFLFSYLATGSTEGLEMVYRENIRRFHDPVNHRGPVYLYLYVIFMLMAPWSLLLPAALVQAHSEGSKHRFTLAFFWAVFLFFTLSSSRRSYYLLPVLPAGALLVANLLSCQREILSRLAYWLLLGGFGLFALVVVSSIGIMCFPMVVLGRYSNYLRDQTLVWAMFLMTWFISLGAIGLGRPPMRVEWIARAFVIVAYLFMLYGFLCLLPEMEMYRTQKPFAENVKSHLGAEVQQVGLYRNREIVFYLDQPTPLTEYRTPDELTRAIREKRLRWLIARRRDAGEHLAIAGRVRLEESYFWWESREQTEGKLVLVEIVP